MVASATIFRRGVGRKANLEWHMGLVAVLAGLFRHTLHVWFVAIETRRTIAMFGVTGRAVEGGMDRRVFLKLF